MEESTHKEFKEALSNVYPVYENCDGRETVYKGCQQVKIETSDGIIDGYVGTICGYLTITYGTDETED